MSAPAFLAQLALRSRGLAERAVPSLAPLFASRPDGATWGRVNAGDWVGIELDPEQAATVIDPPRPTSVRSTQQHAAARPEDQVPSPTQRPVPPPVERQRVPVLPPASERTAADIARSSANARDQVQALVESILEQRPADRTDHEHDDRPGRTDPAGDHDPPGPDAALHPARPETDTDTAMAPPRPAPDHHPIARPAPTPAPAADRSRRTQRPVVRITIGRLEIRAQSASPPPRPSAPRARQPALSLDEYLRRRSRGSR
jgi:hypothetical protein